MRRAEQEHRSRVLGTDAAEEPASVSGEPAAGDMLDALEALASEIDAGQDHVASSCERGGVRNDPLLALMCLVQMGAGGPMHVHVAHCRKIGCKKATCGSRTAADGQGLASPPGKSTLLGRSPSPPPLPWISPLTFPAARTPCLSDKADIRAM